MYFTKVASFDLYWGRFWAFDTPSEFIYSQPKNRELHKKPRFFIRKLYDNISQRSLSNFNHLQTKSRSLLNISSTHSYFIYKETHYFIFNLIAIHSKVSNQNSTKAILYLHFFEKNRKTYCEIKNYIYLCNRKRETTDAIGM